MFIEIPCLSKDTNLLNVTININYISRVCAIDFDNENSNAVVFLTDETVLNCTIPYSEFKLKLLPH